jgi:hypothetical protein
MTELRAALARSTPGGRLLARLRRMGLEIPAQAYVRRSYAGRHQLSAGAWRWWIESDGVCLHIGSQYTVAELVAADTLIASPLAGSSPVETSIDTRKAEAHD